MKQVKKIEILEVDRDEFHAMVTSACISALNIKEEREKREKAKKGGKTNG